MYGKPHPWGVLLEKSEPLVAFLSRDELFDKPYKDTIGAFVIHDAKVGLDYATNDSHDQFPDWETVSNSEGVFPDDFDTGGLIHRIIARRLYDFGLEGKRFNGADVKWTTPTSCVLQELMLRDMEILFSCYANGVFPSIWRDILTVYLNDGFPCGWTSHLPGGQLVVFSNF